MVKPDTSGEHATEHISREHFVDEGNQLIVGLKHHEAIIATLHELNLGFRVESVDQSRALGLAKLELIGELLPEACKRPDWFLDNDKWNSQDPVGVVLAQLQHAFSPEAAGWTPPMGRNRLLGHVDGTDGIIILKSAGDPTILSDEDAAGAMPDMQRQPDASGSSRSRGRGVTVGVVDTPLRPHPKLEGRMIAPYPEPYPSGSGPDVPFRRAHSTFVAGLVLQQAPEATLIVDGLLDDNGQTSSWQAAKSIIETAASGANILNLSFACYTMDGNPPFAMATAIQRLHSDTLVVAAAGNYGGHTGRVETPVGSMDLSKAPAWPAALDDVVAVGAVDEEGVRAEFSPTGGWIDAAALGVEVTSLLSTYLNGAAKTAIAKWSGTSFAAARVTGAIAASVVSDHTSPKDAWQLLQQNLGRGDPATGTPPVLK